MSKVKLLLDVVSDLRSLAESIQTVAEAVASNEPAEATQPETSAFSPEPKQSANFIRIENVWYERFAVYCQQMPDGYIWCMALSL